MLHKKLVQLVVAGTVSMIAIVPVTNHSENSPLQAKAATSSTYVTTDKVNLRKGPGIDQKLITTLKKGNTVTVITSKKVNNVKWSKVKWNQTVGWISSSYLKKSKEYTPSSTDKITIENVKEKYKTTANVNMRKTASMKAMILATLPENTVVNITKIKTINYVKWAYGNFNGKKGWVSYAYLEKIIDNPTTVDQPSSILDSIILDEDTDLYPNANGNEEVVAIIPAGLALQIEKTVIVKKVKWGKVKNEFVQGWIILPNTDGSTEQ